MQPFTPFSFKQVIYTSCCRSPISTTLPFLEIQLSHEDGEKGSEGKRKRNQDSSHETQLIAVKPKVVSQETSNCVGLTKHVDWSLYASILRRKHTVECLGCWAQII